MQTTTSRDGTTLGYRSIGTGPGLVLLHGAIESSASHSQLAKALAATFTVHQPDRRGRGHTGPFGPEYALATEVDDVAAIMEATGARLVFGFSSGAIVALESALTLPIQRLAVYEPPLSVDETFSTAWLTDYDAAIVRGDLAEALVIATKSNEMFGHTMPYGLLKLVTRLMLHKPGTPDNPSLRDLAPTFHYDAALVFETRDQWRRYDAIATPVLLLGGGKSPQFFKSALSALETTLPFARREQFDALNHSGPCDKNRGGHPALVAESLRRFYTATS